MTAPKVITQPTDTVPPVTAVRQAPATPSQSPFVVRARALEAKLEADVNQRSKEKSVLRHNLEAQLADLKHLEGLRVGGANALTPMAEIMRRPIVEASQKNPELHYRWIDESKEGRVAQVQQLGYTKISEADGGKQLGKSALYGIPRERHGELEAAKRMRTASRLRSYKSEVQEEVEKTIEELNRQGHGPFKARNHLIDEE